MPPPLLLRRPLSRGFLSRAWQAISRVLDPQELPSERTLLRFGTEADLSRWEVFSDSEYGGLSTAALSLAGEEVGPSGAGAGAGAAAGPGAADELSSGRPSGEPAAASGPPGPAGRFAAFHGNLSTDIADGSTRLRRSGFCGARTLPLRENEFFACDDMDHLVVRVRADGRKYLVSLRTENAFAGHHQRHDVWQAFLFAPPGAWADVALPFSRFLLTVNGRVAQMSPELHPARVVGLGLALAGEAGHEPGGPYRLELDSIRAERRGASPYRAPQAPLALGGRQRGGGF